MQNRRIRKITFILSPADVCIMLLVTLTRQNEIGYHWKDPIFSLFYFLELYRKNTFSVYSLLYFQCGCFLGRSEIFEYSVQWQIYYSRREKNTTNTAKHPVYGKSILAWNQCIRNLQYVTCIPLSHSNYISDE